MLVRVALSGSSSALGCVCVRVAYAQISVYACHLLALEVVRCGAVGEGLGSMSLPKEIQRNAKSRISMPNSVPISRFVRPLSVRLTATLFR
uniref:Putative secreted protein n=1 Tax=Anopheles darlingi TaxID=43151 RepID=A0A2M4D9Y0_ANODA